MDHNRSRGRPPNNHPQQRPGNPSMPVTTSHPRPNPASAMQPRQRNTTTHGLRSGPTQAPLSMDAPGQDERPRAVVFMGNYVAPGEVPRELGGQQLFSQALAGERGWAFRFIPVTGSTGSSDYWVWVVVSVGGTTRRSWIPKGSLKPGEFLCDSMPIDIPGKKIHQPPLQKTTSQQKETVLYRTLQGIWEGIRSNRDIFLAPIVSQEDIGLAERTLYGSGGAGYADLLYRSISPQLRGIMDQCQFNPRDFLDPAKAIRQMTSSWPSDDYAVIYLMVTDGVQHGIKNLVKPSAQNDLPLTQAKGQMVPTVA